jgi:hypothetical protein
MSHPEFSDSDTSFLDGEIRVRVVDHWTGEPLNGVPVYFGATEEAAMGKACCQKGGAVTDQNGFAPVMAWPVGPVYIFIPPDFIQQAFVLPSDSAEVVFECPDFVKSIRHGFNW